MYYLYNKMLFYCEIIVFIDQKRYLKKEFAFISNIISLPIFLFI